MNLFFEDEETDFKVSSCTIPVIPFWVFYVGSCHHLLGSCYWDLLVPYALQPFTLKMALCTSDLSPYAIIWRQSTTDPNHN